MESVAAPQRENERYCISMAFHLIDHHLVEKSVFRKNLQQISMAFDRSVFRKVAGVFHPFQCVKIEPLYYLSPNITLLPSLKVSVECVSHLESCAESAGWFCFKLHDINKRSAMKGSIFFIGYRDYGVQKYE